MSDLETGAATAAVPDSAPVSAPVTEAAPAPAVSVEAPEADSSPTSLEAALDADLNAVWDKHNPAREDDGRFKSTKPVEAAAEPVTEVQSTEPETVEPAQPAIDAPVSWTREMKEQFAQLPPVAKEYIAKRESEATAQITRLGQQVKAAEPLVNVIEQNRHQFEAVGLDPVEGIGNLIRAESMLRADPVAAIKIIAEGFGVDLASYAGGQPQEGTSREVLQLRAEIASVRQQLQDTASRERAREQQDAEARNAQKLSLIDEFSKDKADIALVEPDMIALIPTIRQRNPGLSDKEILTNAYEQAIWINPTLREKRIQAETAKVAAEAQKKAEAAKKAASLNVRSGQNARPARASLDDELGAIFDRNHG